MCIFGVYPMVAWISHAWRGDATVWVGVWVCCTGAYCTDWCLRTELRFIIVRWRRPQKQGRFCVAFDPLDGSSNIGTPAGWPSTARQRHDSRHVLAFNVHNSWSRVPAWRVCA